jgi:hypothetical protein
MVSFCQSGAALSPSEFFSSSSSALDERQTTKKKNPKLKPATHRMTSPQAKELTQQAAANRLAQQQQQREQTGEALYPAEGPEERDRKR